MPRLIEPYASHPMRGRLRWRYTRERLESGAWFEEYTAAVPGAARVCIRGVVPGRLKMVFGKIRTLRGHGRKSWHCVIQTEATDGPWARTGWPRSPEDGKRWVRRNLVEMGLVASEVRDG